MWRKRREGGEEAERRWGRRGERVGGEEKAKKMSEGKGVGGRRRQRGKDEDENIHVPCLKIPTVVCTLYYVVYVCGTRGVYMCTAMIA